MPFNGSCLKVDEAEAKLIHTLIGPCIFFDVFLHCEQDSIHFHHIKGLLSSLLEILKHSRAPGVKQSDIAKRFSVLGGH